MSLYWTRGPYVNMSSYVSLHSSQDPPSPLSWRRADTALLLHLLSLLLLLLPGVVVGSGGWLQCNSHADGAVSSYSGCNYSDVRPLLQATAWQRCAACWLDLFWDHTIWHRLICLQRILAICCNVQRREMSKLSEATNYVFTSLRFTAASLLPNWSVTLIIQNS